MTKNMTSIIILSYNTLELTRMCLESIRAHTPEKYEIIVVDNASADGSLEYLREQADVRLIENKENMGFPKGCNQGLAMAEGDSLLLLNSDTVVTERWLENLKKGLYSDEKVGAVSCLANYVSNGQQIPVAYGTDMEAMQAFAANLNHSDPAKWEERSHLVGFCYLIKREVYEVVGGLDERFTPGNFEDNDYSLRVLEHGYKLLLLRDTFIHHWGSSSFKKVEERIKKEERDGQSFSELNRVNMQKFFEKWQVPYSYIGMKPSKVRALVQKQAGMPWPEPVRQKRMASMAILQVGVKAAELWQSINGSGMGEVCYIVNDARAGTSCCLKPGVEAITISQGTALELYRNGALDGFVWMSPSLEEAKQMEVMAANGVSREHLLVLNDDKVAEKISACLIKKDFGKRVALLSHLLDNSGAPRALLGAAKAFKENGWKAVLFAPQGGPLEREFYDLGIQVIIDPRIASSEFAEMQWTQQYDLLLVNTLCFARSFHSREPFPPIIWWIHEGGFVLHHYPRLAQDAMGINNYDATGVTTIPVSHVAAEAMREIAPNWPLSDSLPFGIDEIPARASKTISTGGRFKAVLIGHLQAVKAQDVLMEAFKLLPSEMRDQLDIYMIGGVVEEDVLAVVKQVEREYQQVKYLGEMSHAEVFEWYKKVDLLLCPSRSETMSITVIEAMSVGTPCLVSDQTGIAGLVKDGENGIVCKAGNSRDLADKLKWAVMHRQELSEIGRAGISIYEENFRPEIFTGRFMALVDGLRN
ncbi:MAG: glycosyltransferase [Selenomonas ruminantium]|nr:glycosyltransferase [Selenomonas ruminantium]